MNLIFEKFPTLSSYEVRHPSGQCVGTIDMIEDGFYYFFPTKEFHGGYWPTWVLQSIVNKIKELDEPYEQSINEYFNENP